MSHTVHPYSHRLTIIKDWKSRWFSVNKKYRDSLKSDTLIREYLDKRLRGLYVSSVETERSEKAFRIIIETSRPGLIIGKNGEGSSKLREDIMKVISKKNLSVPQNIKIDIKEIRSPESNASIVAQMIAEGLEKRLPFRRVMKQMIDKVVANRDVLGAKIELAGRLGGAEMSRREKLKKGQIPLQTFRADIDYANYEAHLPYGKLGIKVWIYKGEIFEDK